MPQNKLSKQNQKVCDQYWKTFSKTAEHCGVGVSVIDKAEFEKVFALIIQRMRELTAISLTSRDGDTAHLGDEIEFYNTEGQVFNKILSWNDDDKCLMIGEISLQQLRASAYIQPSILNFTITKRRA